MREEGKDMRRNPPAFRVMAEDRILKTKTNDEKRTMSPRLFRWMVSACLVVFLAGCATMPGIGPDKLGKIKKVGVLSMTAQKFYRTYVGTTVFNNEYEQHDITDWKVDDEYEAQMQNALAKLALFDIVRIPCNRTDLYNTMYDRSKDTWFSKFNDQLRTVNWSITADNIKAFAKDNALDAVIMVSERKDSDFLAGTTLQIQGAGFYARGLVSFTLVSVLHLLANVDVIDGQTGERLASRNLSREYRPSGLGDRLLGNYPRSITPLIDVPEKQSRAKFNDFGEQELAEIRATLIALPKDAWEPTFRELFKNP